MSKAMTIWVSVIVAVFLLGGAVIVGLGLGAGGYWYLINNKTVPVDTVTTDVPESAVQVQQIKEEASVAKETTTEKKYTNKEFGFALPMTIAWKDYETQETILGGDFNVASVDFFLPTQDTSLDSELPGYFHLFTISVFIAESWNEAVQEGLVDGMFYGDIVGENDFYLFTYSHFNGNPPADISAQAVADMDSIVQNIITFPSQSVAYDDLAPSDARQNSVLFGMGQGEEDIDYDALYSDYYAVNHSFAQNAIEYWNCAYNYELHYPVAWSNNGMTSMSDTVILKGSNGIETKIQAVDASGVNVDDFFKAQYKKEFPLAQREPTAEKLLVSENNTVVYYLAFAAPYERRLYWKVADSDMGIQMTVKNIGTDEWNNMTDMLGSLQMNTEHRVECAG